MTRGTIKALIMAFILLWVVGLSAIGANEIRIAVCGPMTGNYSQYGQAFKDGTMLMAKMVNAAGGINGVPVKIEIYDDKNEQKEGVNIAQRLVADKGVVCVIGHFSSGVCLAAAPVYLREGLVEISPTSSHPDFTKQGNYMFRNNVTEDMEGPASAEYIINKLGKKNIAIIYVNNDWGVTAKGYFTEGVKKFGGKIVASEMFIDGQTRDFTPIITKIMAAKADILFLAAMYTETGMIAQQIERLGYKIDMFGNSSVYTDALIQLAGKSVEGMRLAASYFDEDPSPVVRNFVDSFKKEYGTVPDQYAALAYDTCGIVIEALKKSGPDRAKLRDAIAATKDYPGVTGNTTLNEFRDAVKGVIIVKIENGKFVFDSRM